MCIRDSSDNGDFVSEGFVDGNRTYYLFSCDPSNNTIANEYAEAQQLGFMELDWNTSVNAFGSTSTAMIPSFISQSTYEDMWNSIAFTRTRNDQRSNRTDLTEFDQTMMIYETFNGHSYFATGDVTTIDANDASTIYPTPSFLSFRPSNTSPHDSQEEGDFTPASNIIFCLLYTSPSPRD